MNRFVGLVCFLVFGFSVGPGFRGLSVFGFKLCDFVPNRVAWLHCI